MEKHLGLYCLLGTEWFSLCNKNAPNISLKPSLVKQALSRGTNRALRCFTSTGLTLLLYAPSVSKEGLADKGGRGKRSTSRASIGGRLADNDNGGEFTKRFRREVGVGS